MALATPGRWVGPLTNFYNNTLCPPVSPVYGPYPASSALTQCEQHCAANARCNAMNFGTGYGLPNLGCILRQCPDQAAFVSPPLSFPGVHGYFCNTSRSSGFCNTPAPPSHPTTVVLRSVYADHMVLQHSAPSRIVGQVVGWNSEAVPKAAGGGMVTSQMTVVVELDGVVAGDCVAAPDGTFEVTIGPQPTSTTPHEITVSGIVMGKGTPGGFAAATSGVVPKSISDVLFGDVFLCSGQSNMYLSVAQVNNASAEIAAAAWPSIRIVTVRETTAAAPQKDTQLRIPWGAVTSTNIAAFSAVCYYFGRQMFLDLEQGAAVATPIGLVQASISGTYIESFMPAAYMAACNTTGTKPRGWVPAPPLKPGAAPYNPWGGSNVPAGLWNAMLKPLTTLQIKLAVYDQAEQNLATGESGVFRCLQDQLVRAWRTVWGTNLTFHAVQLPSMNMSEYTWIYKNWESALGAMRLAQAGTAVDVPGVTVAPTIDLADLHSPYGSVHNREKQEVGRRLALHALSTAYDRQLTNTGPTLGGVSLIASGGGNVSVHIKTDPGARGGGVGGYFNGSHDCSACCSESAFEVSPDGLAWTRVARGPPRVAGADVVVVLDARTVTGAAWLRYAYDWMVQCPFFDHDGLPLAPFQVSINKTSEG